MDKLFDWKTILSVVIGGLLLMYVLLPMLTPKTNGTNGNGNGTTTRKK